MPVVIEEQELDVAQGTPCSKVDRRPHILYLIDLLWGMGGAERSLLRTVQLLPKDRFRVTVGTFRQRPDLALKSQFECPVVEFPLERMNGIGAIRTAASLNRFIRQNRVDLVHTFFETSDLLGGVIAKISGRPVISSRRDMGFLRTPRSQWAYRLLGPIYDEVHAVSEAVRLEMISRDGLNPSRVVSIPNGILCEQPAPVHSVGAFRRSLHIEHATHVVVTVGNIRSVKGTDVLIDAARKVVAQYPDVRFLIAGSDHEPEYAGRMRALVSKHGLDRNVRFLGKIAEVGPLLQVADVFYLPSRTEGMSNALLEAMAASLPCVATAVGGNPEVLTGELSELLIPSEDAAAAAARIQSLFAQPEEARRYGRLARTRVETHFSAERNVSLLSTRYDAILGRGAAVRQVSDLNEVDSLRRTWEQMAAGSETIASGFDYQHSWARALGTNRLRIFASHEAIAPLVRKRGIGAPLTLLAAEMYEPLDFLYRTPEAVDAVVRAIRKTGIPLYLQRVPAASPVVAAIENAYGKRAVIVKMPASASPLIRLDETWIEPESHMNSGRRSDFRRARRSAEKLGDVETFILTPSPAQVPELLAEVFRVEAAGWKGSAGTALAADPLRRAFFERYCDAEARAGRLRICLLRIAGRAAAAQIAIQTSTRFSLLRAGYDEEFARTSPGNLLTRESIRHAALAGLATYEFNGDIEPWTRLWTEDALACCSIRIYPFSISGAVAFLAQAAKSFFERVTKR